MKKSLIAVVFFLLGINAFGQSSNSLHLNGGLIIPMNGQVGPSAGFEFTHRFNDIFHFYLTAGYSSWDRNEVQFLGERTNLSTYSEDSHNLYSLYSGTRIQISTVKSFRIFADAEIGYNYLTYNSYQNLGTVDESTGRITEIHVDRSSKKEMTDNLLGLGFGLGFSHSITESFAFLVEYKRSLMTDNFESFRNFFMLNLGLVFNI